MRGTFTKVSGDIAYSASDPSKSSIDVTIDALRTIASRSGMLIVACGGLHGKGDYPPDALTKTSDQIAELRDRKIDVGFVRLPIRNPDIQTIPVVKERLMIVLSEDSVFDTRKGLAALSDAPFILPCRADS